MAEQFVMTLDCSTTSAKCVVWNSKGQSMAEGRTEISLNIPNKGWGEQDANDWWEACKVSIIEAVKNVDSSKIVALAITHQRESFVCLDANNLPLRPAMLWLDTRASAEVEQFGTQDVVRITGKPANPTPAFYKLHWIKNNEPEVFKKIYKVADVHAYLSYKFCGEFVSPVASVDPLGLIDMDSSKYSPQVLESLNLEENQLPKIIGSGEPIGQLFEKVCEELGLPQDIVLVAGGGDGQCAGLGAGVVRPGAAYLSLGTGVIAGLFSSSYKQNNAYRAMAGTIPGSSNYELFIGAGTYMINWFLENFASNFDYPEKLTPPEYWQQLASDIQIGSEGLYVLPYWNGALTPYWDQNARGTLVGFSGVHTKAHVYRAILEGIAFELEICFEHANRSLDHPVTEVIALGGGARSDLWSQMIADVLGIPVFVPKEEEATSLGAAILAFFGSGLYESIESAALGMTARGKRYEPNLETAVLYSAHLQIYRDIYPALANTFSKIEGAS